MIDSERQYRPLTGKTNWKLRKSFGTHPQKRIWGNLVTFKHLIPWYDVTLAMNPKPRGTSGPALWTLNYRDRRAQALASVIQTQCIYHKIQRQCRLSLTVSWGCGWDLWLLSPHFMSLLLPARPLAGHSPIASRETGVIIILLRVQHLDTSKPSLLVPAVLCRRTMLSDSLQIAYYHPHYRNLQYSGKGPLFQ